MTVVVKEDTQICHSKYRVVSKNRKKKREERCLLPGGQLLDREVGNGKKESFEREKLGVKAGGVALSRP
jgi:hypothetical protein